MSREEIRLSFLISWLILSLVVLLVLIAPFALSADTIAAVVPICEWKAKYNKDCPLCGMTTSFILISQGGFKAAWLANKASLPLYTAFVVNELTAFLLVIKRLRRVRCSYQQKEINALKAVEHTPTGKRRDLCKSLAWFGGFWQSSG